MEIYFTADVISNILTHLNKDDSFSFLNMTKDMNQYKRILYNKYLFDHDKTEINFRQYVKNLKCYNVKYVDHYKNLQSLVIYMHINTENKRQTKLPESIKSVKLQSCDNYNYLLQILPVSLQSLIILSWTFNEVVDTLPNTLQSLHIDSRHFNQLVSKLPISLKSLTIDCGSFNQSISNLPDTLQKLEIYSANFNQPIDKMPTSLESLKIIGKKFNQPIEHLPKSISFKLNTL